MIFNGNYIASISQVQSLMEACKSHLRLLTDFEIESLNDEIKNEEPKDVFAQGKPSASFEDGFVYLIRNNRNGFTKIGWSKTPKLREETLQSEEPEISLFATMRGTLEDEFNLHVFFASKRKRGEWFSLTDQDILEMMEYFTLDPEWEKAEAITRRSAFP